MKGGEGDPHDHHYHRSMLIAFIPGIVNPLDPCPVLDHHDEGGCTRIG